MRATRPILPLLAAVLFLPAPALAQGGAGRAGAAPETTQANPALQRRARIQREIRMAFTRAVRNQVGLSDDQMRRLAPINQKYVRQRQGLAREEQATRQLLRAELMKPQPDQDTVARYLAQLQTFPRQRLDLNDAEDRELGSIMTPVQLARFRALQERVQRQLNMMRGARGGRGGPGENPGRGFPGADRMR
ncbi:MAG: hypothetical protein KGN74_14035, partial [Gemmatimonadota bacterium]|nr:hypothetical protein [Gemmatimonadota bacterium]